MDFLSSVGGSDRRCSKHRNGEPVDGRFLLAHDMRFESFLFYNFYILD